MRVMLREPMRTTPASLQPGASRSMRRVQGEADALLAGRPPAARLAIKTSVALAVLGVLVSACTTTPPSTTRGGPSRPIVNATQQPLRDLNVMRETTPEVLQEALREPYAVPTGGCPAVRAQNLRLDAALGPDVDAPKVTEGRVQAFAAETVRSAAALPYRGLVRKLSGAAAIDEVRSAAILAGMVRRGYLKGLLRACGA